MLYYWFAQVARPFRSTAGAFEDLKFLSQYWKKKKDN